ncbi:C40 family peptidase [Bacteroides cutis]|jgi:lipoprotein Spr|uniref:C40 family peptidase n=1 Tax=Bacteroides cutis TaxID=2024197 RepID=UPI0023A7C9DA|nr:C40 family peptidase [Bacteroides cutis]
MKRVLSYIVILTGLLTGLSSCHSSAPRLDYKALAQASIRLGIDIGLEDNHKLYIDAAKWIGTPYRVGGNTKHGTDCSGFTSQLYKEVYRTRLSRSTNGQLQESHKISCSNLREGDLIFFTSRNSHKKVAHVGIYLKDGKFIHASTSQGVIVSSLKEKYYIQYWLCGGRINS